MEDLLGASSQFALSEKYRRKPLFIYLLIYLVNAGSEMQCCVVGAQLEGVILVTACVVGFSTGNDCRAGCSGGHGRAAGLRVQLPHALHSPCAHTRD